MIEKIRQRARLLSKRLRSGTQSKPPDLERRFCVELELISGAHSNPNTHKSILHFSVNKAATQYVQSILARCVTDEGMIPVDINGYAFHSDFPYLDHLSTDEMKKYQHIFRPRGYLYSVFGGMIEGIPDLNEYLVVLMIRDPRDVLVSKYYSIAYSHSEPDIRGDKHMEFMRQRGFAREVSIDEFVIAESEKIYSIYARYISSLIEQHPHHYLTKYEEMIADFPNWLSSLLDYCKIHPSEHLWKSLIEDQINAIPRQEDKNKYLRKGTAGDYKIKLTSQSIQTLNAKFKNILATFDYDL